jgi:hypothetical protein
MYIFKKIIIVATLAMCYVSEGQTSIWGGGPWVGGQSFQERPASGYLERLGSNVVGGPSKIPKNEQDVCDKAKTITTGGKLHTTAWFCLKDEAAVKQNQTFADQWKNANCRQYTETNYPRAYNQGSAPFAADSVFNAQGEEVPGTKMWAVKNARWPTNQLEPSKFNALCKAIAELLVYYYNERACNLCKFSSEANGRMTIAGQVPPICDNRKECKAIANVVPTYPDMGPLSPIDQN